MLSFIYHSGNEKLQRCKIEVDKNQPDSVMVQLHSSVPGEVFVVMKQLCIFSKKKHICKFIYLFIWLRQVLVVASGI